MSNASDQKRRFLKQQRENRPEHVKAAEAKKSLARSRAISELIKRHENEFNQLKQEWLDKLS